MSDVSPKFMRRLAREMDFRLEKTEKAYRVAELLVTLDRHPSVRGNYALKGGTALNVFRWGLPRLSEDADLNYTGHLDVNGLKEKVEDFVRGIHEVGRELGYEVVNESTEQRSRIDRLRYTDVTNQTRNVRVEVNFLDRLPLAEPEHVQPDPRLDLGGSSRLMAYEENVGGKLAALAQRGKGRDLFDAGMIAQRDGVDLRRVQSYFLAHCLYEDMTLANRDFARLAEPADWNDALLPMVRRDYRAPASDTLRRVKDFVSRLPPMSDAQVAGWELLRAGDARGVDDFLAEVSNPADHARNPALLWRLEQTGHNVATRRRRA